MKLFSSLSVLARWALLLLIVSFSATACDDTSGTSDEDTLGSGELAVPCSPGAQICFEGELATCTAGGNGWRIEACSDVEFCVEGACLVAECGPGTVGCEDGGVVTCGIEGQWSEPEACGDGLACIDGACEEQSCEPDQRLCAPTSVMVCQADGSTWVEEPCDTDWVCFGGQCVQCLSDTECADDEACVEGVCSLPPLGVVEVIAAGMVDRPYAESLEAEGGKAPYTWTQTGGALPDGLTLATDGMLTGTPTTEGDYLFSVEVTDSDSTLATGDLAMEVLPPGLAIATDSLPTAEEGLDYSTALQALGGTEPYAWGINAGALPIGLTLASGGVISGVPSEIGDFPITVRVFDNTTPPNFAQKDFTLTVDIAPLEIIGDQSFDLLFTKIITLPLIVVASGLPIPYSTQLEARGGLRPYTWTEIPIPAGLSFIIPTGGIPDGLTLATDGTLSGSASDPSQVITITIPFTQFELTGFFFMAEVKDSQSPAESKSALFLIPTVPIGGP